MKSAALCTFEHSIQDADDLLALFDSTKSEVLKRASLVMALAALETYIEDRIIEAVDTVAGSDPKAGRLSSFYKTSLENDLKTFHSPSTDRVRTIFQKYLALDITAGWSWNNYDSVRVCTELNKINRKRGDIAHRSARPVPGQPTPHAVTRDDLRKHIHFIKSLATATDAFLAAKLTHSPASKAGRPTESISSSPRTATGNRTA